MATIHIAGHYTAAFTPAGGSSATLGTTRDGWKIIESTHEEPIHTDEFGDTVVDAVHRGGDVELELDYADYTNIQPLIYSHGAQGNMAASVGKLASALAGQLVLTAAAGTSAATYDGAKVFTFTKVKIITNVPTMLANHVRQGPLRCRAYPDPTTGKHYTWA